MPAKVITSLAQASNRGIFALFLAVQASIIAAGTGRAAMVAQLPWGPVDEQIACPNDATFLAEFAPPGFDRTNASYRNAYLMAMKFPYVDLQVVGIRGAGAAAATIEVVDGSAANSLVVNALYKGAGGTGISVVIAAADDAVTAHFNMTLSKTDAATGLNTTEIYKNVDSTQAIGAPYWTALVANSVLVGPIVRQAGARPANNTYTLAGGSDGTVGSSNYLGTQGAADHGIAVLELDDTIDVFFCDDVGSANLAAVNAGIVAHVNYKGDQRIGICQGLPGESSTTAITNRGSLENDSIVYVNPHCIVYDDLGTQQVISLTGPYAAILTIVPASVSPAIKKTEYTKYLQAILGTDVPTTNTKDAMDAAGVCCFNKNANGTYSPYSSTTTSGPNTPVYQTRMRFYIAETAAAALEEFRNSPNADDVINSERDIIDDILAPLKVAGARDSVHEVGIVDYALAPQESTNTQASIDAGDETIAAQVELFAEQKRLFLMLQIGQTVTVTPSTGP